MPRNYENEMRWRKTKYKQVGFMAEIHVAEKLKLHLAEHGVKPIDWFRHAVSLDLLPPFATSINEADGGEAAFPAVVDGAANGSTAACAAVEAGAAIGAAPGVTLAPAPKKRMRRATPGQVDEWASMRARGMTYAEIAAASGGYEMSTVRKNILARGATVATARVMDGGAE